MQILVVEEDHLIVEALTAILTRQNYAIEVASDGETGWKLIDSVDYDLIVLDVMQSKVDGIHLCHRIRSKGLQTPILLLTDRQAEESNPSWSAAIELEAGADDYILKPFDERELLARIQKLLQQGSARTLHRAKDELELRVAERTAELVKVNQQLQAELDEHRHTQAALRVSQARLAGIVEISDDAIISIDQNQKITLFNKGAEKIFGYTAQEAIGQPLDILIPMRFMESHRQNIKDFGKSAIPTRRMGDRREIFGRRRDGSEFPAEASISKLHLEGETTYTVFLRDITERKQVERMKDEFVSIVSHELRTPLTSIHGSLGMLTSGLLPADSEQGRRLLHIAVESTDRLVRLINDILDIERIESGRVQMEKTLCNLADIMTEAVDLMQPLAEKAAITLSVSTLPIQVWADCDRIVQTLTNLLSNAIKFSPNGSTIWLDAEEIKSPLTPQTLDPTPHASHLRITVKDQGRGIPADKLDSIFERFQQVDSSDSRHHDGTGLGLAICRSIVQQHGGQIGVESVPGQGSTFYFTLPLPQPSNALPNESFETSTLQPSKGIADTDEIVLSPLVLVCHDSQATQPMLQTLLEQQGYRVATVDCGKAAIEQAGVQRPDMILLLGTHAWETMALLKQHNHTSEIPMLICRVSPATSLEPTDLATSAVNETALFELLHEALAPTSHRICALIVEDDDELAEMLSILFERHGIKTFRAKTGREAIQLSQQLNPDLLVLDLVLPQGDGFTVVEWLQQHSQLCRTPLVVYSVKELDRSERDRLKLGPTQFLTKGRVTIQDFEQRVMTLLQHLTQNALHTRQNQGNSGS